MVVKKNWPVTDPHATERRRPPARVIREQQMNNAYQRRNVMMPDVAARRTPHSSLVRAASAGLLALVAFVTLSGSAFALVPQISLCGRVTALVPPVRGVNNGVITLGTQPPRTLGIGGDPSQLHLGDAICLSGVDVRSTDGALGLEAWTVTAIRDIGCGALASGAVVFTWPILSGAVSAQISLTAVGSVSACPRLGLDAAGNPVVVAGAATTPPPATPGATATGALPSTSTATPVGWTVALLLALGILGSWALHRQWRRRRRARS